MNYFAHGRPYVGRPYMLAGVAVPDWLSVVNRKSRARSRLARPWLDDPDPRVQAIARGIIQHHEDDRWFHQGRAFMELNLQFTVAIRDRLPPDNGFRPSFLGHILVELLLDSELIAQSPHQLDDYYACMDVIDPEFTQRIVNRMTTRPLDRLDWFIPRFSRERFLYDYLEDEKLLTRLNHVMVRVGLPEIPSSLADYFPEARQQVRSRQSELLGGPTPDS